MNRVQRERMLRLRRRARGLGAVYDPSLAVDKPLQAIVNVAVYRDAYCRQKIGVLQAGSMIGIISAVIRPKTFNNANYLFAFKDKNNQYYYVPYRDGAFSITLLQKNGLKSDEDIYASKVTSEAATKYGQQLANTITAPATDLFAGLKDLVKGATWVIVGGVGLFIYLNSKRR